MNMDIERIDDEIARLESIADEMLETENNSIGNEAIEYLHRARVCMAEKNIDCAVEYMNKARELMQHAGV